MWSVLGLVRNILLGLIFVETSSLLPGFLIHFLMNIISLKPAYHGYFSKIANKELNHAGEKDS